MARRARFPVTLSAPAPAQVTVDYVTQQGTAVEGVDYQLTSGTLTFAPGETRKDVLVPLLSDTPPAQDLSFTLVLSNVSPGVVLEDSSGACVIPAPKGSLGIAYYWADGQYVDIRTDLGNRTPAEPFTWDTSRNSSLGVLVDQDAGTIRFMMANGAAGDPAYLGPEISIPEIVGAKICPSAGVGGGGTTTLQVGLATTADAFVAAVPTGFVPFSGPVASGAAKWVDENEPTVSISDWGGGYWGAEIGFSSSDSKFPGVRTDQYRTSGKWYFELQWQRTGQTMYGGICAWDKFVPHNVFSLNGQPPDLTRFTSLGDSFTEANGTLLVNHAPDTAPGTTPWMLGGTASNIVTIRDGMVRPLSRTEDSANAGQDLNFFLNDLVDSTLAGGVQINFDVRVLNTTWQSWGLYVFQHGQLGLGNTAANALLWLLPEQVNVLNSGTLVATPHTQPLLRNTSYAVQLNIVGTDLKVYIDGLLVASTTLPAPVKSKLGFRMQTAGDWDPSFGIDDFALATPASTPVPAYTLLFADTLRNNGALGVNAPFMGGNWFALDNRGTGAGMHTNTKGVTLTPSGQVGVTDDVTATNLTGFGSQPDLVVEFGFTVPAGLAKGQITGVVDDINHYGLAFVYQADSVAGDSIGVVVQAPDVGNPYLTINPTVIASLMPLARDTLHSVRMTLEADGWQIWLNGVALGPVNTTYMVDNASFNVQITADTGSTAGYVSDVRVYTVNGSAFQGDQFDDLILDTFTGAAGELAGHTPDFGDPWLQRLVPGNSYAAPDFQLDGNATDGGVGNFVAASSSGSFVSKWFDARVLYVMEIDFTVQHPPGDYWELFFRLRDNGPYNGLWFNIYSSGSYSAYATSIVSYDSTNGQQGSNPSLPSVGSLLHAPGVLNTFRMEVFPNFWRMVLNDTELFRVSEAIVMKQPRVEVELANYTLGYPAPPVVVNRVRVADTPLLAVGPFLGNPASCSETINSSSAFNGAAGTALSAYVPDVGASPSNVAYYVGPEEAKLDGNGSLYTQGGATVFNIGQAVASKDVVMSFTFTYLQAPSGAHELPAISVTTNWFVQVLIDSTGTCQWILNYRFDGSASFSGTFVPVVGQSYTVEWYMTAREIILSLNGQELAALDLDQADTRYQVGQLAQIRFNNQETFNVFTLDQLDIVEYSDTPAASTLAFQDNFNGAAGTDVVDHTPDLGPKWSYGDATSLGVVLDGNGVDGAATLPLLNQYSTIRTPYFLGERQFYAVEVDFTLLEAVTGPDSWDLYLYLQDGMGFQNFFVDVYGTGSDLDLMIICNGQATLATPSISGNDNFEPFDGLNPVGQLNTLRLEVYPNYYNVIVNGVTVVTHNTTNPGDNKLYDPRVVLDFGTYNDATMPYKVNAVRVENSPMVTPVTPWEGKISTLTPQVNVYDTLDDAANVALTAHTPNVGMSPVLVSGASPLVNGGGVTVVNDSVVFKIGSPLQSVAWQLDFTVRCDQLPTVLAPTLVYRIGSMTLTLTYQTSNQLDWELAGTYNYTQSGTLTNVQGTVHTFQLQESARDLKLKVDNTEVVNFLYAGTMEYHNGIHGRFELSTVGETGTVLTLLDYKLTEFMGGALPPLPPQTLPFSDTFSDTGALNTRNSDSDHTWTQQSSGATAASFVVGSGVAALQTLPAATDAIVTATTAQFNGGYALEGIVKYQVPNVAGVYTDALISFYADGNNRGVSSFELHLNHNHDANSAQMQVIYTDGGGTTQVLYDHTGTLAESLLAAGVEHTFHLEANGSQVRLSVDGVRLATLLNTSLTFGALQLEVVVTAYAGSPRALELTETSMVGAVTPAAVPLVDNFSGNGPIEQHASDSGAGWDVTPFGTAVALEVSGGYLQPVAATYPAAGYLSDNLASDSIPTQTSLVLEAKFIVPSGAMVSSGATIAITGDLSGGGTSTPEMQLYWQWQQELSQGTLQGYLYDNQGNSESPFSLNTVAADASTARDVEHTVRLEMQPNDYRWYLDGVLLARITTYSWMPPMPHIRLVPMVNQNSTTGIKFNSVSLSTGPLTP